MANHSTTRQFSAPSVSMEQMERINTKKVVNDLLRSLSPKERDIVKRRFGLDRERRETLQEVGEAHGLTRERIRQVENSIIAGKLRGKEDLKEELAMLKDFVVKLLEEHGGVMEKEYMFNLLDKISETSEKDSASIKKNHLDFLLSRLFANELEELKRSPRFKQSYKLKGHDLDHLEEVAEELAREVNNLERILKIEELLDVATKLSSYFKHQDKLHREPNLDIDSLLEEHGFYNPKEKEVASSHRSLYSLLQAVKDIEPNKFGYWGAREWSEISPKTINDKIYLVLKNQGEPMHFTDLAERINAMGFDNKKANPATIHNELILDDKYVLIGRGMYGLKEWGLKEGTVADVIREILAQEGALTRGEIVQKVLDTRMVKKSTINLALSNRREFQRTSDGKYTLRQE